MNNERTFDWKAAAFYWGQGKEIQYINGDPKDGFEWIDDSNPSPSKLSSMTFHADLEYRLRPEPVETVKWARGAWYGGREIGWNIPMTLYNGVDNFIREINNPNCIIIFPARFNPEGFLIIPDEFKHLK